MISANALRADFGMEESLEAIQRLATTPGQGKRADLAANHARAAGHPAGGFTLFSYAVQTYQFSSLMLYEWSLCNA